MTNQTNTDALRLELIEYLLENSTFYVSDRDLDIIIKFIGQELTRREAEARIAILNDYHIKRKAHRLMGGEILSEVEFMNQYRAELTKAAEGWGMSRADCIRNKSYTPDGTPIEGHVYEAMCAIYDCDTDRTYTIGKCENCGKVDAGWENGLPQHVDRYGQLIKVGGPA